MRRFHNIAILMLLLLPLALQAQEFGVTGTVLDAANEEALSGVLVILENNIEFSDETNQQGQFSISGVRGAIQTVGLLRLGYETLELAFDMRSVGTAQVYTMKKLQIDLQPIIISEEDDRSIMEPMPVVRGTGMYSGMKSEVISMKNVTANISTNNSRQVYNRIAGLNIWENDGAGIQLGIGARGLSPNRTSNFNVRQNLYDISADALGYPESYYAPPLQGVERIELVRGAAGLQFGTQFGGLLNFEMKDPPPPDSTVIVLDQTLSSFGLGDSITDPVAATVTFVSIGHAGKRSGIYGYYQYKQGQGWRTRSDYEVHTAFVTMEHRWAERWHVKLDLTHMDYLAQQAGGLTDEVFALNPRITKRSRNWFKVDWNIASLSLRYSPNSRITLESKTYILDASREALGFLGETQRPDPLGERDLIAGDFNNLGNETRILHRRAVKYGYFITSGGLRLYHGLNRTQQGFAGTGDAPEFEFNSAVIGNATDYEFPNWNLAAFAQTYIPISPRLSLTPGIRYEFIDTQSEGTFRNIIRDGAGNVIEDTLLIDKRNRTRDFFLMGAGLSYKWNKKELYFNLVQNYRAINFTDIQVRNTSLFIDPEITDERGYNMDLGLRGTLSKGLSIDVSLFALVYQGRIGEYFTTDAFNRSIRYRSNISDARTLGVELYAEQEISEYLFKPNSEKRLSVFINGSYIDAKYTGSAVSAFEGKRVELVPQYTLRTGIQMSLNNISLSLQYSHVADQFSDATNVGANPNFPSTPNAVDGLIPAYSVMDLSMRYQLGAFGLSFSINNLTNEYYFTRRASGYPGPGIIPSDGRSFHLGVNWTVNPVPKG